MASPWTDERAQFVIVNWPNISAREIAASMSATEGIIFTKGMVIGRAHRMGLPPKKPPPRPKQVLTPAQMAAKREARNSYLKQWQADRPRTKGESLPPRPRLKQSDEVIGPHIPFSHTKTGHCRFECADADSPGNFRFCTRIATPGTSWCSVHHKIVCVQTDRQRAAA